MLRGKYLLIALLTALVGCTWADEYRLPDPSEMTQFSPDAMQFYNAGVKAIDKVDYTNAYSFIAKAAQLEPDAIRLNYLAAALGLKHGRAHAAATAHDYYETAVNSYKNILRQPDVDADFRREVENRLKIALDEKENLEKRDTRREALGGQFVKEYNLEYAPATPRPGGVTLGAAPVTATPGVPGAYTAGASPLVPGIAPTPAAPMSPGGTTLPYPQAIPTPAPAGMPAAPGAPPAGSPGAEVIDPLNP